MGNQWVVLGTVVNSANVSNIVNKAVLKLGFMQDKIIASHMFCGHMDVNCKAILQTFKFA